jgi:hypothetical protein
MIKFSNFRFSINKEDIDQGPILKLIKKTIKMDGNINNTK